MARVKHTAPRPTRNKGQISLDLADNFLTRSLTAWMRPDWYSSKAWRNFVLKQPIAIDCKETLIAQISSLDWKVDAVDPNMRDEYKADIDYYTQFFDRNQDYDFITMVEWIASDYLDLPFGGAAEIGRLGDKPNGKVVWIRMLDGGTLFPTLSRAYPVGQSLNSISFSQTLGFTTFNSNPGTIMTTAGNPDDTVYFPNHAINRIYMSPRSEIQREGWGMAPPEKIFFSLELLNRGDIYYANLLLDTPEAGILDLADMDGASAQEWIKQFRNLLGGIDPLKVPVLYEHDGDVKWIPFGRPPTEMMFDRVTTKYAALVASAYGISLSDIGFQSAASGGETLAGSIRQERRMKRTGFSRIKKKLHYFFNKLLPPHLEFNWIDMDDELSLSIGRSRLANAQSAKDFVMMGILTPSEIRHQMVADGLITIPIPDEIPEEDKFTGFAGINSGTNSTVGDVNNRDLLGKRVPPSMGGHGEVTTKSMEEIDRNVLNVADLIQNKSEIFSTDIDYDIIVDDYIERNNDDSLFEHKNELKNTMKILWENDFIERAEELRGYLNLGRMGLAYIAAELRDMRYNIIEKFDYEVSNIAKKDKKL
jgi:hypothetical protein